MGGVLPAPWLIAEKDAKKRHRKLLRNVLIGASVGGIPPLVASLLTKRANDPIKKRVTMHGIGMGIEWKKGEKRRYYDKKDPKKVNYEKLMKADYGYISGTKDHDGEQLDAYVGPNPKSTKVFVIKQLKDDGSFDEHKVMLGYDDLAAAKASYLDHMPAKRLGKIEETDVDGFKAKHLERAREMRKAAGRRFVAGFTKEISKTAPGKFKFPEWMLQSTWRPPEKIGRRRVKAQFRKAAGPRLKILRQLLGERFGELGLEDVVDVVGNVQDVKDRTTEIKGYRVERNQPAFKVAFVRGLADELEKLGTFVRERIREGGPGTRADNPPDLPPGVHSMSRTAARQKPWSGAAGSADAFGQQSTPKGADEVTEPMVSPSSPVDAFG
jgi:inorganic pyrophosphatase